MLLANKKDLQQKLRLSILTIEEKELIFYFQNMQRVGTISAFFALFILGAFQGREPIQEDVDNNPIIVNSFLPVNMIALLLECTVVYRTMELCIRGPGLGLRGPEGSMTRAVFIMRQESKVVYRIFYAGLFFFLVSTGLFLYALSQMELTMPIPGLIIILLALCWLYVDYSRTERILRLPSKDSPEGWSGYDPIPHMPDPRRQQKTGRARAAIARACNRSRTRALLRDRSLAEGSGRGSDAAGCRSSIRSGNDIDPTPPVAQPLPHRNMLERMASKLGGGGDIEGEQGNSPAKRRSIMLKRMPSRGDMWLVGQGGATRPDVMADMGDSLGIPGGCSRSER
jgi:hypothetical protein